jgi:hypothetical protein
MEQATLAKFHESYFVPWETFHEANPQELLDRREAIALTHLLIMQGAATRTVRSCLANHSRFGRSGSPRCSVVSPWSSCRRPTFS